MEISIALRERPENDQSYPRHRRHALLPQPAAGTGVGVCYGGAAAGGGIAGRECGAMKLPQPVTYGLIVGAVVFFVGWITRMGGGLIANVVFGVLMGILAGVCFALVLRFGRK